MIKEHMSMVGALVAMTLILATGIWFVHSGMHEGTLLGVLITGAVQIGQQIAGIKQGVSTPLSGSTFSQKSETVVQTPPDVKQ